MIEADCPDQICVNHLAISRDGESIICLPNKVVIAIEAGDTRNVFTSLALILSYVELLIPINFGIPGMKLGLANLLVVILLYKGCPRDALLLSVIRILLSGLIFGNMFSIFYSLGGGLLSLAVMVFLKKTGQFTVAGISIGGGASHNVGQLLVAMFVVQTYQVGYYLPVLLIAGVITGAVIGILSAEVLKRTQSIRL